jgi:hypothetical protein
MAHCRVLPPVLESSKEASVTSATMHSLHTQNELRQQALQSSGLQKNAAPKMQPFAGDQKLQRWMIPALLISVTLVTLGVWSYV